MSVVTIDYDVDHDEDSLLNEHVPLCTNKFPLKTSTKMGLIHTESFNFTKVFSPRKKIINLLKRSWSEKSTDIYSHCDSDCFSINGEIKTSITSTQEAFESFNLRNISDNEKDTKFRTRSKSLSFIVRARKKVDHLRRIPRQTSYKSHHLSFRNNNNNRLYDVCENRKLICTEDIDSFEEEKVIREINKTTKKKLYCLFNEKNKLKNNLTLINNQKENEEEECLLSF
ncbi:uncharacterized protein LOC100207827 [Hydra vulgaris]|uniref:uncharacterized protein LOC100207827 n=1 Tax=Hydra vulgaris TaxID=6087 RepID=UPI00019275B7|nr:uncharacterized protein LOC100207827 [Hydra vulgaris]XP_012566772.1 uncharacterized protein LOC100207827 [Hydra vulgaris]XP_012566773.1 uncharacterized protein LOC100207827 [Hydra vulgaris]